MKWIFSLFLIYLFSFQALAQYQLIEMNPPKAKQPLKNQLDRMEQVKKYKFNGQIGETDQALLAIHDVAKLPKKEQETIKKLVDAENKDRKAIYKAISEYNKLNERDRKILIKSAFETYKGTDPKGVYHLEGKTWQKKY